MSGSKVCRLCRTSCTNSIRLTDASGATNEIYNITIKFFDPMFLEIEKETTANQLSLLCMQCWHHISRFNNFQQTVLLLHANLHKAAESAIVVRGQEEDAGNSICNTESMSDMEISNAELRIKPDPETITLDADMLENQNTEQSNIKLDEKRDAIDPLGSTTYAEYDENVQFHIKNVMHIDEEFQDEEFSVDELSDESENSNNSDDEQLEIGRPPQSSNGSCDENDLHDGSLGDNDGGNTSELPGRSAKGQNRTSNQKDLKESDEFIANWRPILKCKSCPKSFPTLTLLKAHFRANHPTEEFYIMCCERKLQYRFSIEEHATFHINPKELSCKLCGTGFKKYGNLRTHMMNFHPGDSKVPVRKRAREIDEFLAKWKPEIKCEYCSKSFPTYSLLRKHFLPEHPNKTFYIQCCDSKLRSRSLIIKHATLHIHPSTFTCPLCGNSFISKSLLNTHTATAHNSGLTKNIRKITEEMDNYIAKWKPCLNCEYCSETFPTYTLLKMHCQDQHPDREFYILCCGKKIMHRYRVEEHAIMHMKAATFRCLLCGNCMGSELSLKDHMMKIHPSAKFLNEKTNNEEYKFKCSLCEFCCSDEATLVQHGNFHTELCRYCNSAFDNKESLKEHMAVSHSRISNVPRIKKCEFCPKTFKNRSGHYTHFRSIHPEEFARRKKWYRPKTNK
ncbi:uncharacterized protein isoform X2 [Musca autumnalis]|uniref:uncharacterized protein isoform X2 n=1 Tax=Musca autumnalis TaxID=221902 RepID=UPI003CEE71C0